MKDVHYFFQYLLCHYLFQHDGLSIDRNISSTCWKILFCDDDNAANSGSSNISLSLSIPVSK